MNVKLSGLLEKFVRREPFAKESSRFTEGTEKKLGVGK
jgi:hypothetical protein